jgi:AraC-like DNA-binding protein
MTLRDYIWTRRISCAAFEHRDTDQRVLDVAVKYGFLSQETFTRAFNKAFQLTPCSLPKRSPTYSVGFSSGSILALSLFDQGAR